MEDNSAGFVAMMTTSSKKIEGALMRGIRKALGKVKKDVTKNLRGRVKGASKRSKRSKYNDTLLKAVATTRIYKNDDDKYEGKVRVTGNRKKGSGTFRAKFFELGTKERGYKYTAADGTRKVHKTGRIKAGTARVKSLHFNTDVTRNTATINKIVADEVANAMKKIKR